MPFLTEQEEKEYEKSPFINKYSVENYYDYGFDHPNDCIDVETISRAREIDLKYDGDNFCGKYDSYTFDLFDTLKEALEHHHKRIDKVEFQNLTEEEMKIVEAYKEEKMNDDKYLAKFGISKKNNEETKKDEEEKDIDFEL